MGDAVPMLADKYKRGQLQLDEFISWRFSLDQINTAIEKLEKGDGLDLEAKTKMDFILFVLQTPLFIGFAR